MWIERAKNICCSDSRCAAMQVSSEAALSPYNEVFSLERFRENELIHGRWAMLAALGVIVAEASTGVSWCVSIPRYPNPYCA